jgi:hypothetical protein
MKVTVEMSYVSGVFCKLANAASFFSINEPEILRF